jgi:hypothetical protein
MKKLMLSVAAALAALSLLNGCIVLSVGGGSKTETTKASTGQQLLDLQKARDSGAITPAEYEAQKAKLLEHK